MPPAAILPSCTASTISPPPRIQSPPANSFGTLVAPVAGELLGGEELAPGARGVPPALVAIGEVETDPHAAREPLALGELRAGIGVLPCGGQRAGRLEQRVGQLSLVLRGMSDANAAGEHHQNYNNGLLVVRSGVAIRDRAH